MTRFKSKTKNKKIEMQNNSKTVSILLLQIFLLSLIFIPIIFTFTKIFGQSGISSTNKLHQFNITNVVAILGTSFTKEHLFILKSLCKKITFCFDGDKAGQLASIKSAFMCLPFLFDFKLN